MSLLRRIAREVRDTIVMGGLASAGGARHDRTTMPLVTRPLADALLPTVRDVNEQGERARAAWSVGGAAALAALGLLAVASGWQLALALILLLGAAQLLGAAAVLFTTLRRATRASRVHLAGITLAAVWLYTAIVARTIVSAQWALVMLLLAIGAVVGLVVGRR